MSDSSPQEEYGHVAGRHDVNSEALLSFLITLAELFVGLAVWLKNPRNEPHRLFLAFVACLVLWGLSDAGLRMSENRAAAEMVHKFGAIGFCLFPAVFLHFVSVYTGYGRRMNRPLSYVFLYGGALALAMFHNMGFITEVTLTSDGVFSVAHARGYDFYVVWISLCCLISASLMVRRYPSSSLSEQRTLLLLSFGLIVVIVAALLVDALIPLYGFRPLMTGGFSSLVIVNLFGFALSKTQLMTPAAEIVAERVLHATDDLVCVIGQDGYLSYATDVFRRALHLNQGEQLGRIHLRELVEEADRVLENASNAMHGPVSLEVHFKTRTGFVFPAALSVSQLLDRTKPTGLVLVGRDISEPRELARKYEESQEKYQNIVESSLDGIVIVQGEALVFVNPSAIRIFGYESAHEMMQTRFNDIVAPDSRAFLLGNYQQKKIGEDLFRNYEMTGLTKSGNFIDLEINAKLVTWNGKMAVQASFRDITERKHHERDQVLWFWEQESLRAIDKQLTASFELDRVLNTVSRNAGAFSGADFSGVILIQESKFYQWRGVKGNRSAVGSEHYLMKGSHRDLMASGQPRVIRSFGVDPGFPATDFPVLTAEGLTTVALFPFGIKEDLEGVLVVGFRKTRNLSEPEHRLLSSLADKAAIAIANAALYEDLLEREKELEQLTDARMEAEEAERRRIARELHDGLGQILSAIKFNIEVLEDAEGLKEADLKKLREVKQLLDSVMTEAREISHNLMPSVLEDFGLKPALQLLCESFAKRLEIPISFQVHGVEGRMGNALEVNIYRIAQEGLNNISKHAHAKSVSVQLHFDEGGLRLTIEDEGEGFTTPLPKARAEKGGMGLINMKHRASTFGGSLTVESHPGKGTTIIVQIPHAQEQQQ